MSENRTESSQADQLIEQLDGELSELKQAHQTLREKTRKLLMTVAAVILVAAVVLAATAGEDGIAMAVVLLIGSSMVTAFLLFQRHRQWATRVLEQVMPAICDMHEKLKYAPTVSEDKRAFVEPWQKLELVAHHSKRELNHHLRGRHRNRHFEVVAARLSTGGKDGQTVFDGLLMRIQTGRDVPARIVVRPRSMFSFRLKNTVEVKLGNESFDERFEVCHDEADPKGEQRVREIFTPEMQEALLSISREEGGLTHDRAAITAGFIHDSLYLTLVQAQSSKVGKVSVEKPVKFLQVRNFLREDPQLEKTVREALEHVGVIYRIIDRLPERQGG